MKQQELEHEDKVASYPKNQDEVIIVDTHEADYIVDEESNEALHPDWIYNERLGMLINKNLKEKYTVGNRGWDVPIRSEDQIEEEMNDHSWNKNANGLWYAKHNPCGIQDCNKRKKQECEHEFITLQYRDQPNPDHVYYSKFRHCKKCGRNRTWFVETHDEHTQNLLFKFDDHGCWTEYSKLDSSALSGGYNMKWNMHEENPLFESYKSEEEYVEHEKERIRQAELEGYGYTNIKFRIKITRNYKTRKHGMESYF